MDLTDIRTFCAALPGSWEDFPFDDTTLVFKAGRKMFALSPIDSELRINLKCDPDEAINLRETYSCVLPGYHMNKRHWNTIIIDHSVSDDCIFQWIENSYNLVLKSMSIKERDLVTRSL